MSHPIARSLWHLSRDIARGQLTPIRRSRRYHMTPADVTYSMDLDIQLLSALDIHFAVPVPPSNALPDFISQAGQVTSYVVRAAGQ